MKAIVQDQYGPPGDVLELQDIDEPLVKDGGAGARSRDFRKPRRLAPDER